MSVPQRRLSPRQRRLRAAVIAAGVAALVGLFLAGYLAWRSRTQTYKPGEDNPEITRRLSRDLPPDAPIPRFTDVTRNAGLGAFAAFSGTRSSQLPEDMGSGLAWGDFDDDGDDDLFVVGAGGNLNAPPETWAASLLFENRGDGTFAVSDAFPELRLVGMGAAWADYDGDGWDDLVVSGWNALRLYHNDQGRLVPSPALPDLPGFWTGVSWADFDLDGDLDLYVCGYVRYEAPENGLRRVSQQYGNAVPYTLNPASYEAERNLLFRNDGSRGFTEVAAELGVDNPGGRSLSALWQDFDADGWPDLYVANDISDNALYLNEQGRFRDASHAAWVADYRGAMGLASADWNRDGDDDLFVTHWVAQENALYDSLLVDLAASATAQRPAPRGAAGGMERVQFGDVATLLGLGQPALKYVGWGAEFADIDADGWPDLLVANGSTFETKDVPPALVPQPLFAFWNRRGEFFHDLAPALPVLAQPREGRGLALADYDGDGDLDVALVDRRSGLVLLRNDMSQGNWLQVRLRRREGNVVHGRGEGALVVARVGGLALRRTLTGASYLSQSARLAHFGLGDAAGVATLEVRFPGSKAQVWQGLETRTLWELTDGDPEPRRLGPVDEAERRRSIAAFWELHREGMRLLKRQGDSAGAAEKFRAALRLNPEHEDARYYLATVLQEHGELKAAIAELQTLARQNPQSHRAFKQLGTLLAMTADGASGLAAARDALERALAINKEETGSLLLLGEVDLLQGRLEDAERHLELACRTNPRAVGGFFLRGYVAWKRGDPGAAGALLRTAHAARGPEWKPEGSVAEGDVRARQHREITPLSRFWESWDGTPDPAAAFVRLDAALR